jgi:hypothetical protein
MGHAEFEVRKDGFWAVGPEVSCRLAGVWAAASFERVSDDVDVEAW